MASDKDVLQAKQELATAEAEERRIKEIFSIYHFSGNAFYPDISSLGNLTNITFIHIRHHPYIGQTGNRKQRIPLVGAQLHIPANLSTIKPDTGDLS